MSYSKNINLYIKVFLIITLLATNIKAAEECFEDTSRAVFKFNMALDNMVMEPIAKGYNKLPSPIKKGTSKGDHFRKSTGRV